MRNAIGFTLIELMAAIVIVGVLVALAVPRYRVFVARSRQGEAAINLGLISKLQQSYYLRYGSYFGTLSMGTPGGGTCAATAASESNDLGFRTGKCANMRYTYKTDVPDGGGNAENTGADDALLIYPGCKNKTDKWEINEDHELKNSTDIIKGCQE